MNNMKPIGVIRTPFTKTEGTPIQPAYAEDIECEAIVDEKYLEALSDLDGFERVWLIYWFHDSGPWKPRVIPFRDKTERGLFATRAPSRPNPIGISAVRLLAVEGNRLRFRGADMLDGTPLLDIKPYSPRFDSFSESRDGWLQDESVDRRRADARFSTGENDLGKSKKN